MTGDQGQDGNTGPKGPKVNLFLPFFSLGQEKRLNFTWNEPQAIERGDEYYNFLISIRLVTFEVQPLN